LLINLSHSARNLLYSCAVSSSSVGGKEEGGSNLSRNSQSMLNYKLIWLYHKAVNHQSLSFSYCARIQKQTISIFSNLAFNRIAASPVTQSLAKAMLFLEVFFRFIRDSYWDLIQFYRFGLKRLLESVVLRVKAWECFQCVRTKWKNMIPLPWAALFHLKLCPATECIFRLLFQLELSLLLVKPCPPKF
jgi:hypothetical protein